MQLVESNEDNPLPPPNHSPLVMNDRTRNSDETRESQRKEQNREAELLQPEVDISESCPRMDEDGLRASEQTISSATTTFGRTTPLGERDEGSSASITETETGFRKEEIIYVSRAPILTLRY